ncbi:MAG: hypothetical protein ACOCWQ_04175 [Nanoarchaeota archaeon]
MEQTLRKAIIFSFCITVLLFSLGYLGSYTLDFLRMQEIQKSYEVTQLKTEAYLLEQQLYQTHSIEACARLELQLWNLREDISELGSDMAIYKGQSIFLKKEFDTWKRRYIQSQIRLLQLLDYIQVNCAEEKQAILYFFEVDDQDSITQGYVLQEVANQYNDTLVIFSFDIEYQNEPTLNYLKSIYDIKEPALIMPDGTKMPVISYVGELRPYLTHNTTTKNQSK